ncbi:MULTISPECIES: M28 family peptidase [unclassified Meiothermus]|uniref:M28 family peptidase n=1 Tax=unclassified Meiothermus TaxID=370471 RepID=UPI000D7C9573|nr:MULTISPECIES: M28 family peptidase [unclassified Meiothermus]PZA08949.1 aminopeptidase [Meiothermus sp. Pnk-1]RYM33688.1 M28 family peptidase [Meiothermus sp. PNK-Is4]
MRQLFQALTDLPHRGSATALEARAAEVLEAYLEGRGHKVEAQPFKAPRSYGPELILISFLLALGGLLAWWPLGLLGSYGFWAYFSGQGPFWSRFFDRYASQNLLVRAGFGPRTLVLMAHYDTAKTFFLYHPRRVRGFRQNFLFNAALALGTPLLSLAAPGGGRLVGLYFLAQAAVLIHRELTAPYVNGANDNASGVAVAVELFERLARAPSGWQILLALTGSEEVGAKGAMHLARSGLIPQDALVLNFDNLGKGELCYAAGEGMLAYRPYVGALVEQARRTPGARAVAYRLAYFDTRPFAAGGYSCLTLIRLQDGLPPHWHWSSDTPQHVDPSALEGALEYAQTLLQALGVPG